MPANASVHPSIKRLLGIRVAALISFSLLIFAILVYTTQFRPTFDHLADTGSHWAAGQVVDKVRSTIDSAEEVLLTAKLMAQTGLLEHQDPAAFNRQMLPLIEYRPTILGAHLANDRGEEMMLSRTKDGSGWSNRITRAESWGTERQQWLHWGKQRKMLGKEWRNAPYDARIRPWFTMAMAAETEKISWSEPYMFAAFQEPGITLTIRWVDVEGSSWILALDIRLLELAHFTGKLEFSKHGSVAILLPDGRVIAPPRSTQVQSDDDIRAIVLTHPTNAGFGEIAKAYDAWRNQGDDTDKSLRFNMPDGKRWIGRVEAVKARNQPFLVTAVAPYEDFTQISESLVWGLLSTLIALIGLSAFLAIRLGGAIAGPLKLLAGESRRIGALQLDAPVLLKNSTTIEIATLVNALEDMRGLLLKATSDLAEANSFLEERVQARTAAIAESESRLRHVLEQSPIGVAIADKNKRYVLVNQSLANTFGLTLEEIRQRRSSDAWARPAEREDYLKKLEAEGLVNDYETEFVRANGEHFWVMLNARYIEMSGERYLLSWLHDISVQREAREAILVAKDVAEEAARTKSEFLANMTHELRTPMHAILSFSDLGVRRTNDGADEKINQYFSRISQSAERLLH